MTTEPAPALAPWSSGAGSPIPPCPRLSVGLDVEPSARGSGASPSSTTGWQSIGITCESIAAARAEWPCTGSAATTFCAFSLGTRKAVSEPRSRSRTARRHVIGWIRPITAANKNDFPGDQLDFSRRPEHKQIRSLQGWMREGRRGRGTEVRRRLPHSPEKLGAERSHQREQRYRGPRHASPQSISYPGPPTKR